MSRTFVAGVKPYASAYLELGYQPGPDELLCAFRVTPRPGVPMEEAAAAVAAESSTGTWTEVWSAEVAELERIKARVYDIEGDLVRIAYPYDLFEPGSLPNILSSVVGNVFGFKPVPALRLEDMRIPLRLVQTFPGPGFGVEGVRDALRVHGRPMLGSTIKPKLGLSVSAHAQVVYETLAGGIDTVKDDENLNSQSFNDFYERISRTLEAVRRTEAETGERKGYWANVTAGDAEEMVRRAEHVKNEGGRFVMVDYLTAGFAAVATLRKHCGRLGLIVHGHRAMHAVFTRQKNHGVNFLVAAKWGRMVGLDHLHVGTGVGKLEGSRLEIAERCAMLRERTVNAGGDILFEQEWGDCRSTVPVASGGLHPGHAPDLFATLGPDAFFLFGGGAHGHPGGSRAGARAARAAVEASAAGIPLEQAARESPELHAALQTWSAVDFD